MYRAASTKRLASAKDKNDSCILSGGTQYENQSTDNSYLFCASKYSTEGNGPLAAIRIATLRNIFCAILGGTQHMVLPPVPYLIPHAITSTWKLKNLLLIHSAKVYIGPVKLCCSLTGPTPKNPLNHCRALS
jgi:hypothetical protein